MATKKKSGSGSAKVLAVMRGINISDAPMYSIVDKELLPVAVTRHGIRGTQNVAKKKTDKDAEVSNIQITESAKTHPQATGMHLRFALQVTPLSRLLTACDSAEVRADIEQFLARAANSEELMELCRRYARRVFSGSFLWRNLTLAHSLDIHARCAGQTAQSLGERPFELAERGFSEYTEDEMKLARWLQSSFASQAGLGQGIEVSAKVHFSNAGAFEVYPSQMYVSGKPQGFARPLYKLNPVSPSDLNRARGDKDVHSFMDSINMGQAAIRDQKVGNAIRTIDTWYAPGNVPPIAIEPNGASLSDNEFHRRPESGNSFFDLLPGIRQLTQDLKPEGSGMQPSPDAMFVLAVFIRGGVFGDASKSGND
ncbi:type I-F CRISPR-associated protein Csy3 [Delftia acidovorans]|jgi:CRISPR-associated protein Csy3|uniref:type I-F CRISPR-associated protein Csy3 n=1 Tax=Delftia acidovorans TaxID=80866 RepID=UPI0012D0EBFC|nr:type I-F CRISPR-associated protein Csy3 [Delftia acidovorans]MPS46609.1 type I-F CRISPR-associated protein Csy3 [Stenotrophomonas sp.]